MFDFGRSIIVMALLHLIMAHPRPWGWHNTSFHHALVSYSWAFTFFPPSISLGMDLRLHSHNMSMPSQTNRARGWRPVDGGKNPSQQRGSLLVPQDPIRRTNVWYGRPDGIMDLLPSKGWFELVKLNQEKEYQLGLSYFNFLERN